MADWRGMKLTSKGLGVMAKLLTTDLPTVLTRVALGDGILQEGQELEDLDSLISEHTSLPISTKYVIGGEVVQIETSFKSTSFPEAVKLHEIGVFATDPETGEELLYAVDNAAEGDTIPMNGGGSFIIRTFRIRLQVANADNVTFAISDDITAYKLERVKEVRTSVENQKNFTLSAVDSKGALDIFINGALTVDWAAREDANGVVLDDPLPAGAQVIFCETVLRKAGA